MKIELWSDYTCPYCYIGKRQLELALEQLGLSDDVTIELKSYELDAEKPEIKGIQMLDYLKEKYNLTQTEVNEMLKKIKLKAEELELVYNFANIKQQNTFDAHRLVKYAYDKNKGELMAERLLNAYFSEAAEISNHEVLINLAKEVALDIEEVTSLLCLNNYAKKVRNDIEEAKEIGIEGVPFFIIDDKFALSGVQSIDVFIEVIKEARSEYVEKPKLQPAGKQGSFCTDEICE